GGVVPECAVSVGLRTATIGRSARGRAFVGPLVEGVIDDGTVNPTQVSNMQADWERFQTDLAANSPSFGQFVASYKLALGFLVTSYSVKPYVATQRRRLVRTR